MSIVHGDINQVISLMFWGVLVPKEPTIGADKIFTQPPNINSDSPVRYAKFQSIWYFIDIDILQILLVDIDIDIFQKCRYIDNRYFLSIYWTGIAVRYAKFQSIRYFIDIDILQNLLINIDIDIFQKYRYIDNRYFLSIYRTGLGRGPGGFGQRQTFSVYFATFP